MNDHGREMGRDHGVLGLDERGLDTLDANIKLIWSVASNVLANQHGNLNWTAEILRDEQKGTTTRFALRALRWFREQGVRVWRILTDIQTRSCVSDAPAIGRWCEDASVRSLSTIVV